MILLGVIGQGKLTGCLSFANFSPRFTPKVFANFSPGFALKLWGIEVRSVFSNSEGVATVWLTS